MTKKAITAFKLIAMKIAFVQVVIILSMLTAAAKTGNSQEILERKISLSEKDIRIKDALQKIEKIANVKFIFSSGTIGGNRRISFTSVDKKLKEWLDETIIPLRINYKPINNSIILFSENSSPAALIITNAGASASTDHTIRGRVTNTQDEPLAGVSVLVKGTKTGTVTDGSGQFSLSVPDNTNIQLEISFVGYQTLTITANEGKDVVAKLAPSGTSNLEDVVVVGYGSNVKRNLLQSVSSVNAKKVVEIPVATLSQSLAGRLPGLFITQTGGKPGRASNVRVRAYDGFVTGTTPPPAPLFVIDGLIVDQFAFDGLDASQVENISVLKDGASAAVYGVRGANGVIVVTTKKGMKGAPRVNLISSYSLDHPTRNADVLNAYEQGKLVNDNLTLMFPTSYQTNALYAGDDELEYWKTHSVNMTEKYYKDPAEFRNALTISGGSEKVSYFLGGSYYKGTGTFNNMEHEKFNVRARVDAEIGKNLTVTLNLSSDIRKDLKPFWLYDNDGDDMTDFYRGLQLRGGMGPDYIDVGGVSYPVGNYLKWHPGEVVNGHTGYNRKKFTNNNILVDATYKIPFINGLKLRGAFASYNRNDYRKQLNTPYNLYVFQTTGSSNHLVTDQIDFSKTFQRNDGNWVQETYLNGNFYQLNLYLNYDKSLGNHNLAVMAGYEQSETQNNNFLARNQFIIARELDQLSLASSDAKDYMVSGAEFQDGRLGTLGRVAYNYAGKYLAEAAFRYEGSRYFVPSKRYAFFPSFSVGWRISDEKFFKDVRFVNDLKIRGSLGFTGDDASNAITTLQWAQYYRKTPGAYFGSASNGVIPGTFPNADITWAKKRSLELGLDALLFDNKVTLTAAVFKNKRTDILGARIQSIPTTFGYRLPSTTANQFIDLMPLENYGIMESHGLELDLGYRASISKNLTVYAAVNYAYAVNKQVQIDQAANIRAYQSQIGRPQGSIFGYIATGVIQTKADLDALPAGYLINGVTPRLGMLNFKDIRGATTDVPDGKIDANDQEFIAKYTTPPASYGLSLGAAWKSFSLDIFIQGVSNYYRVRSTTAMFITLETTNFGFWRDYWSPENPDGQYPLVNTGGFGNTSTFWLDNGAFIRLKNVNVGWSVPEKALNKIGLQSVKLFFNGSNLFLFQDKTKWYDPEGILQGYPISKNYTFGLNISL